MPKASKQIKNELYSLISKRIMDARIEIAKKLPQSDIDLIDEILFRLNIECPQSAINYFEDTID